MASTLLLNVQDASIQYGEKILFKNLSFSICEGEKICLVGKNGVGKTTLMNIIQGARDLDEGERWQLQGSTVGYLQQDVAIKPGQTVFDFVFEGLLGDAEDGSKDYKIHMIIDPLHLDVADKMDNLSGGQIRRAALARALVEAPDILLLDEPTNHLDLDIIEWLESYLKYYHGAVVCISHDKAFLATISEKVFWLDRGNLRVCPKGFAHFDEWSTQLLEHEERELKNRQKVLDQEVEWASRGVKARRKRNVRRVELMKMERDKLKADKRSLQRMLAKIEFTPLKDDELSATHILSEFFKVHKSYLDDGREKVIFNGFNLRVMRGDRIGILGKNGCGKTSFLKLLIGEIAPDMGKVKLSKDIRFSYFDQKRKDLNPAHSIHRTLCPNGNDYIDVMGKTRHICGYLKDFLFDPKMVHDTVGTLSGGQKNRLLLAKVLANPGDLLILDEPTNDLDMDTLDMLEDILSSYKGTLIVVSHDRDFLDQTVSKILAFEGDGRVEGIIGGYQDYLAFRQKRADQAEDVPDIEPEEAQQKPAIMPVKIAAAEKPAVKLSYKHKYEWENLPGKITALEKEIADLNARLTDSDFYARDIDAFHLASRRHAAAVQELAEAEHRWLELDAMMAVQA